MSTLYDHIQELRAELRGCYFTRRERAAVQAELAKVIAEQAELDRAFDVALEVLSNPTEAIGAAYAAPPLLRRSPPASGGPKVRDFTSHDPARTHLSTTLLRRVPPCVLPCFRA